MPVPGARAEEAPRRRPVPRAAPTRRAPAGPVTLQMLQSGAGNAAVAALVQRLVESPAPPVVPAVADPHSDPRFTGVAAHAAGSAKTLKKHPSGAAEAHRAREAAQPPTDDKVGQAKAAHADRMATAKPKGFDEAGFVAAVKAAIAKAAPNNLNEADKFAGSGKADAVKGEVLGKVTQGKVGSAKDVAEATAQPPDPSVAKDKPVTPLTHQAPPPAPVVDGAGAMPAPAPPEQTDLRAGPAGVNAEMAKAEVTDAHLAASGEPQMHQAAAAKKDAEVHSAQAPGQIRKHEAVVLAQARTGAAAGVHSALAAMAGAKATAGSQVGTRQNTAKTHEETERRRVSGEINKIFDGTKTAVEATLTGLDAKVAAEFDKGEGESRRAFTAQHKAEMDRYKDQRYSGVEGWARWTADLFTGLPKEAGDIFARARAGYEQKMTGVISGIADLVGRELDAAKARIATGRQQIKDYVASQPVALRKLANEAAGEMTAKFDQLDSDVDAKQESLVDDLAQKYMQARNAVDEEITTEQQKNQGFVDMARNMVGDAVKSILALKDLFLGLLAKAASAFTAILDAPVRFITNFMSAVKQGFLNFGANILGHLKKGLQGWLFGQLASAGIELPDKFDLMGILKMIASMLGLTWAGIKARIAAKDPLVGQAIDLVESKIEIFVALATKGVAGVWEMIKEKVGDFKTMIFDQIRSFVIEKIVTAGITWVLGLLNPAGALVKIVQALVGVVQWIMERGAAMGEFIGTIIDAVMDVARGGGGGVPAKIEAALGKAVPLVLSFLAGLLGLSGISEKVRSIIEKGQKLVSKGIDWVVGKALKLARPMVKLLKRGVTFVKGKVAAGKAWVKGKSEAMMGWTKGKIETVKDFFMVRRRFTVEGAPHVLYTAGLSPDLTVASTPVPLAAHPDSTVRSTHSRYRIAVDREQTVNAKRAAAARELRPIVAALKTYIKKYAPGERPNRAGLTGAAAKVSADIVVDLARAGVIRAAQARAGGQLSLNQILSRIRQINRDVRWVKVAGALRRAGDESLLHPGSVYGLGDYVRYHVHGPGTGLEGYPILLAPTRANQFANSYIEAAMRRWLKGGAEVEFKVSFATFSAEEMRTFVTWMLNSGNPKILGRLALDQGLIEKFLKSITYDIRVVRDGQVQLYRANITVGAPGSGMPSVFQRPLLMGSAVTPKPGRRDRQL